MSGVSAGRDPSGVAKGIVLIASGTYNAGQGSVGEAEEDFAGAFEMFAPVRGPQRQDVFFPSLSFVRHSLTQQGGLPDVLHAVRYVGVF